MRAFPVPGPRAPALLFALSCSGACFSPPAPGFVVDTLAFHNDYTESDDIVIQPYEYADLLCPDGSLASFYTVYREGLTEAAPIVIFFHSGAFDYVLEETPDDPLHGEHYQPESRLDSDWANQKIFETLGLVPGDGLEENDGTLPAALADAGAFTLYPTNCWGDLWHNEYGYAANEPAEGFTRNGRYLAWVMSAIASPDAATAAYWQGELGLGDLPIQLDFSAISLVGLGEGGRAIPELFRRSQTVDTLSPSSAALPPIRGVVIDSTMDSLAPITTDASTFSGLYTGLERIFATDIGDDIGKYSLGRWYAERGATYPVHMAWSSGDPEVPDATNDGFFATEAVYPTFMTDMDYGTSRHVFLNSDIADAQAAVRLLLGQE